MKAIFAGDPNRAHDMWHNHTTSVNDFIDFILANIQLTHKDCEGSGVSIATLTSAAFDADAFGPNDGTPTRNTGIDLTDIEAARAAFDSAIDGHDSDKAQEQRWRLEQLFDDVFIAAIESGLLVEKAVIKAGEAVDRYDQIAAARNRVIDAQLSRMAPNDPA